MQCNEHAVGVQDVTPSGTDETADPRMGWTPGPEPMHHTVSAVTWPMRCAHDWRTE